MKRTSLPLDRKGFFDRLKALLVQGAQSVKKAAEHHFFEFYGFCFAKNVRFRPGTRAGTDPLRRAFGRQNPQSTKTSGFSSVLTHTPQGAFSCPCGAIHLVSSETD